MNQAEPSKSLTSRTVRRSTALAAFILAAGIASCATTATDERTASLTQAETPDTFGIGSGRDGDFTAPAPLTVVNSYAPITAVNAGATQVTIGAVHGAAAGFAADDLVLLWHTTGIAAATSGDQTLVALAGDVGTYEFARVKSVAAGVVTVTNPLSSAARFATASQIVRVPEYKTLTIGAGASVTPYAWDGSSGGIVVVFASVAVANAGAISANASGFRGGGIENAAVQLGCTSLDNWSNAAVCGGAHKGEGLLSASYAVANLAAPGAAAPATYGRGNYANGAGGGDAHNAGGGGGGHGGVGGMGGRTWINDVAGGTPRPVGGLGGAPVTYTLTDRLVFGGGGGAGDENNMVGTSGAQGGGVVLLRAATLTGAGAISATGGSVTTPAGIDGCGGGGAGGAVLIQVQGAATCGTATANGGAGGSGGNDPDGPGGGGAGGRVLVQAANGTCAVASAGGLNGITTTANALYTGTAYGATPGAAGTATAAAGTGFAGGICTPALLGANQCGGCVLDTDCPPAQPICDPAKNTCGTCTSSRLTACTGATPTCDVAALHDVCAACNGDYGSAATRACPTAANAICATSGANAGRCVACVLSTSCNNLTPVCSAANVCVACGGDNGTAAPNPCSTTANPYCKSTGACGLCVNDASCGVGHAGALCNTTTGACGNACTVDAQCAAGNWCNNLAGAGQCQPKTINGQPVPGGTCVAMVALRACVSGVCDPDNACGYPTGSGPCTGATAALVCRSGSCDVTSGKCGAVMDGGVMEGGVPDGGVVDGGPSDAKIIADSGDAGDGGDAGDAGGVEAGGDAAIADSANGVGDAVVAASDANAPEGGGNDSAGGNDSSVPDAASSGAPAPAASTGGTIAGGGLSCSMSSSANGGGLATYAFLFALGVAGRVRRRGKAAPVSATRRL